jgi:hypothetical protein
MMVMAVVGASCGVGFTARLSGILRGLGETFFVRIGDASDAMLLEDELTLRLGYEGKVEVDYRDGELY